VRETEKTETQEDAAAVFEGITLPVRVNP
jgi:hypothetical protein